MLSLAFDRPPASHDFDFDEDLPDLHHDATCGAVTYRQGMSWISHLGLRYLPRQHRRRSVPSADPSLVWQDIELIEANILPHLKDVRLCTTVQQIQEHHSFGLHRNFFAATVCRQLVSPGRPSELGPEDRSFIVSKVQQALRHSAQAYLDLRSLSTYARRSWAFIHNGLASVLLLSLIRDTRCTAETRRLQDEFINSLKASTASDCNPMPVGYLSSTLKKALKALVSLRRLADQESGASASIGTAVPSSASVQSPEQQRDRGAAKERRIAGDGGDNTKEAEYVPPPPCGVYCKSNLCSMWAVGGWDIPLDFDLSPLQTFDYIMSDPYSMRENMGYTMI